MIAVAGTKFRWAGLLLKRCFHNTLLKSFIFASNFQVFNMSDDRNRIIYCGNIHDKVTEELLYELFLQVSQIFH